MNSIVEARIKKRMTQKRLAHEAGIAARTLRKLERGEEVSLDTLNAVYKVLGIGTKQEHSRIPQPSAPSVGWDDDFKPETFGEFFRYYVINASIICLICMAVIFPFLITYKLYKFHQIDAVIDVYLDERCVDKQSDQLADTLESVLTNTTVLSQRSVTGTDSCKIRVRLNTDENETSILDKLSHVGLKATLTDGGY